MEIVPNLLCQKDLLGNLGQISYHLAVTEGDFWRAVGERLAKRRRERRIVLAALAENGPTNKTVQDIEKGNIKQLGTLRSYADAVGVNLIDVFRAVLLEELDEQSEDLQFVIRQFREGGVLGRNALVSTAELVAKTRAATDQERPSAPQSLPPETQTTPRTVRKPREKK